MLQAFGLSLERQQKNVPRFHNTFCTSFRYHRGKAHFVKLVFQMSFDKTWIVTKNSGWFVIDFREHCQ